MIAPAVPLMVPRLTTRVAWLDKIAIPAAVLMVPSLVITWPPPPSNNTAPPVGTASCAPDCTFRVIVAEPTTLTTGVVCGLGAPAVQVTVWPAMGALLSQPAQTGALAAIKAALQTIRKAWPVLMASGCRCNAILEHITRSFS